MVKSIRDRVITYRDWIHKKASLNPSIMTTFQAGGILLFANGIVTALGLIRTPLITWTIPKDQVGMMGVVFSWLPFINLLSMPGIDSSTYHYVSKGQTWTFPLGTIHRFRWSLLSSLAFLIGAIYWFLTNNYQIAWMFVIAGVSFPFSLGMTAAAGMFSARGNFRSLFWYRLGESLTDFAGFIPIFFSVIFISEGITFYSVNQFATAIMQISVTLLIFFSLVKKNIHKPSILEQNTYLNYGKHLTALTGISVLQSRADAFLISIFQPMDVMADYSIALILQEQLRRLWNIYTQIRYPALVQLPVNNRKRRFIHEGGILWLFLILIGIIVALFAHWLVPILLPPEYSSSLVFIDLLFIAVLVGVPGGLVELFYRTQQDEKSQYKIRLLGAFSGVLFPVICLILWGAIGVAVGRILSNMLFSITSIIIFSKANLPLD